MRHRQPILSPLGVTTRCYYESIRLLHPRRRVKAESVTVWHPVLFPEHPRRFGSYIQGRIAYDLKLTNYNFFSYPGDGTHKCFST